MELTVWHDADDDWSGLASPAERRRRQNRLNQRASRQRKHMRRFAVAADKTTDDTATTAPSTTTLTTTTTTTTTTTATPPVFFVRDSTVAAALSLDAAARTLRPGALAALVHCNVLHALALNAAALGIPADALADYDAVSPVVAAAPQPPLADAVAVAVAAKHPPLLAPTALQRAVPHHPWVDVLPLPRLRDNILCALVVGALDEDGMCCDLAAPAAGCADDGRGALTVWGDAADVRNWEYSPGFLRKYLWLFDGCDEVFEATDSWRAQRGERRIGFRTRG